MQILIVHQYFLTPEEGGAIRSYHLAKGLSSRGHQVTVITGGSQKGYQIKEIENFTVHYLPVKYHNILSARDRIRAFMRFSLKCIRLAPRFKHIDYLYAISSPLTIGIVALWIKNFLRKPYIFEVGDLWPQAPIEFGVIKNPFLKRWLFIFERKVYRSAEKLIALSPPIMEYILEKAPGAKIELVPNMADTTTFQPQMPSGAGIFNISYIGAISEANYVEDIVTLARHDQINPTIRFHIMGEGKECDKVRGLIEEMGLKNVELIPFGNQDKVVSLMNISEAVIITYKDLPVLTTGSPNKLFDGLAAGKLIIINFEGWIKDLIEQHHCGFYYEVGNTEEFNRKINPFLTKPDLLKDFQQNARELAENKFSKDMLIDKLNSFCFS